MIGQILEMVVQHDYLRAMAGALGLPEQQFDMIVRHVNEEAMMSLKWGTPNERFAEIKRRMLVQA